MSYRETQCQLKIYRQKGYVVPRLNSTKATLQEALQNINIFIHLKSIGALELSPDTITYQTAERLRNKVLPV